MVIIKYYKMAMSTKSLINKSQSKKRTLRSSQKHSSQYNNTTGCQSQDKVIDQIKKQIQHQQAINASKSTYPVPEELKALQQLFPEKELLIRNDGKVQPAKNKCLAFVSNTSRQRSPQICHQLIDGCLGEKSYVKQKHQKQQPGLMTPRSKLTVHNLRNNQETPYKEQRKSYRKFRKCNSQSVPYRKCQDQFQQKIVTLMNKICYRKSSQKDVENLCQKVQKISSKELYNPYIVSGIQTILNLLEKSQQVNVSSLSKLKNKVKKLYQKIQLQLGKTDQYEKTVIQERRVDIEVTRPRMMKKVYKILIQSKRFQFKQARQRSFHICQQFFDKCNNHANEDDILLFIKDSKFLQF